MSNTELELGYAHEIALWRLAEHYASSDGFKSDWEYLNAQLPVTYRLEQLINRPSLIDRAFDNKDNFTRLTDEWRHDWGDLVKAITDDARLDIERIAEKWGLRCDWGCGFIMFSPLLGYSWEFIMSPGPPNSMTNLSAEIDIYDTADSIKDKIADFKKKAKKSLDVRRENANAVNYRGFERHTKKDISTQVQWLFWHITPPYLNAAEIAARLQNTEGDSVDQFYIQRRYQNMARLLGINLIKGWTKGRRRASQEARASLRRSEIEANVWQKNDL